MHITDPTDYIREAVSQLTELLTPTYGPRGGKVLVSTPRGQYALDDGLKTAKEFTLEDSYENAALQYVKETLERTNYRVGDGTTTSVLLLDAFLDSGLSEKELRTYAAIAVEQIRAKAKKADARLEDIAYNSFNDREIAKVIADLVTQTGRDGVVSIERGKTTETTGLVTKGLEIQSGYVSPYFVTDQSRMQAVIENPLVLTVDRKLASADEIVSVLEYVVQKKQGLVIVAHDFDISVLTMLALNKTRGILDVVALKTPGFGNRQSDLLKDIAALTGATIVASDVLDMNVLGACEKIVSRKETSVFTGGKGDIVLRVASLENELEQDALSSFDSTELKRRIAALRGGVGIIRVGANTAHELEARIEKVDDALNATKEAYKNGIVPGGGRTLAAITSGNALFDKALAVPRTVLLANGADLLDAKAVDPAGVLIAALESAVSIAAELKSVGAIIVVPEN